MKAVAITKDEGGKEIESDTRATRQERETGWRERERDRK